jgi:hypothetical protein
VDPSLSLWRITTPVLLLCAFLFVELVFCPVDLSVAIELVPSSNGVGDGRLLENFEELAVRDDLAREDSVKPETLLAAEGNWLIPGECLLEEEVLKVARNEFVFKLVAVVIDALLDLFTPLLGQPLSFYEDGRVELDQSYGNVSANTVELQPASLRGTWQAGEPGDILSFLTRDEVTCYRDGISRPGHQGVLLDNQSCLFGSQLVLVLLLEL